MADDDDFGTHENVALLSKDKSVVVRRSVHTAQSRSFEYLFELTGAER